MQTDALSVVKSCELHCVKCGARILSYDKRRKYCSRECWAKDCKKNLGEWVTGNKTAARNSDPAFRIKVSQGVKRFYQQHYFSRLCEDRPFDYGWMGWDIIRNNIIARDKHCLRCHTIENLRVHHIIPVRISRDHSERNLIALCNKCHQLIEKNQLGIQRIVNNWKVTQLLVRESFLLNH